MECIWDFREIGFHYITFGFKRCYDAAAAMQSISRMQRAHNYWLWYVNQLQVPDDSSQPHTAGSGPRQRVVDCAHTWRTPQQYAWSGLNPSFSF